MYAEIRLLFTYVFPVAGTAACFDRMGNISTTQLRGMQILSEEQFVDIRLIFDLRDVKIGINRKGGGGGKKEKDCLIEPGISSSEFRGPRVRNV